MPGQRVRCPSCGARDTNRVRSQGTWQTRTCTSCGYTGEGHMSFKWFNELPRRVPTKREREPTERQTRKEMMANATYLIDGKPVVRPAQRVDPAVRDPEVLDKVFEELFNAEKKNEP